MIYRKLTAIYETVNVPITFCDSLTSIPRDSSFYQITYQLIISSFKYEWILKTFARSTIGLCDSGEVTINVSQEVLKSFKTIVNEKKIVAFHQESLQKIYLCPSCKSSMLPKNDDIVECSCEVIVSVDTATPNQNVNVAILDENKC